MSPVLVFEIVAVVLGALYAMTAAAKKNFDFVGTYALAIVVSFGGGTIRDVLLGRRPFFWAERWEYLVVIFVLCIPFVYSRAVHQFAKRVVARGEFIDAVGLGFYAVVGATLALEAKQPAVVAILLGVITSTGGGIMGDVLTNEIPGYFRHGTLYIVGVRRGGRVCWAPTLWQHGGGYGRSNAGGDAAPALGVAGDDTSASHLAANRRALDHIGRAPGAEEVRLVAHWCMRADQPHESQSYFLVHTITPAGHG
jgi:uncharacterized membrane protein YeiH